MKLVLTLLHLVFGGIFIYAGLMKAWDPAAFLMDVRSFDLLPDPYAAYLAMFLPWLEILAGQAVITGAMRKGGLIILNGSLVVFLIALCISFYRGIDVQCGCFGSSDASGNYIELIVRDVVLLAVGLCLYTHEGRRVTSLPSSSLSEA